jgi:hypothetical protein
MVLDIDNRQYHDYIDTCRYESRGEVQMMDPNTAVWLAGRAEPHRDRDAEQLAALRDAGSRSSSLRSIAERVDAFFGRSQSPAAADCDCRD